MIHTSNVFKNKKQCVCGHSAEFHQRGDASCIVDGCTGCADEGFTLDGGGRG